MISDYAFHKYISLNICVCDGDEKNLSPKKQNKQNKKLFEMHFNYVNQTDKHCVEMTLMKTSIHMFIVLFKLSYCNNKKKIEYGESKMAAAAI